MAQGKAADIGAIGLGVIGLGVMGRNLAANLADHGAVVAGTISTTTRSVALAIWLAALRACTRAV